jgi:hypothetical protein
MAAVAGNPGLQRALLIEVVAQGVHELFPHASDAVVRIVVTLVIFGSWIR